MLAVCILILCNMFMYISSFHLFIELPFVGPDFGAPPSFMRRKLLTVLSEFGKTSAFIDDVSIVKRYASESTHVFPVSSDDEALLKARKEV